VCVRHLSSDEKGAAVLRMLRAYLAKLVGNVDISETEKYSTWREEPFLAGLRTYLLEHSYGVATNT
jgi:hypothetical protein